jgi:hypothetical protein
MHGRMATSAQLFSSVTESGPHDLLMRLDVPAGYPFPYLFDEDQKVAEVYQAGTPASHPCFMPLTKLKLGLLRIISMQLYVNRPSTLY